MNTTIHSIASILRRSIAYFKQAILSQNIEFIAWNSMQINAMKKFEPLHNISHRPSISMCSL